LAGNRRMELNEMLGRRLIKAQKASPAHRAVLGPAPYQGRMAA